MTTASSGIVFESVTVLPEFAQASRSAPPGVAPVVLDGVRYEQLDDLRLPRH